MEDGGEQRLPLTLPAKRTLDAAQMDREECEQQLKLSRNEPCQNASFDMLRRTFAMFAPRPDTVSAKRASEQVDALACVVEDGLSDFDRSALCSNVAQKIVHGDSSIISQTKTCIDTKAAKCIKWKNLIVFIGTLIFSAPEQILRTFANFVVEKRDGKRFFDLLIDETGDCNTHLTRFCLSYVTLKQTDKKTTNLLFDSLSSAFAKKKDADLVAFQIYVTINPGKNYKCIPANRLLLLSQGKLNCHVYYGFVPRDLSPTEYKACIEAYLDSINVFSIVKHSFPIEKIDATTVSTSQVSAFNFLIMVGKGKLAEKTQDIQDGLFAQELWPHICVVTRITKIGHVQNLGLTKVFDPSGLHNLLGNNEDQSVIKISKLCGGFERTALPEVVFMGSQQFTKINYFTNQSMKKALLDSAFVSSTVQRDGQSKNEYKKIGGLPNTNGGLFFDVKVSDDVSDPTWAVHSRVDQCCIGDKLSDQVFLSMGTSLKVQEEYVVKTVGSMPGIITLVGMALNESIARMTELQVPALRIPVYHTGMCETLSRSLAMYFISLSDSTTKRVENDSEYVFNADNLDQNRPYSREEMEELTYFNCLSQFKIRQCTQGSGAVFDKSPPQSVFQLIFILLFCMIVCNDDQTVFDVMSTLDYRMCVNYDVFFDNPQKYSTKELAVTHWFVMLLSSLVWVVDVVYGRAKNMPKSWLSMRCEGYNRSQSFADFVTLVVSSCANRNYTQCKLPAYASINPKKMLKILAILREWQLSGEIKSWDDIVAEVSTWDCEKAKEHLVGLMDELLQMKAKFFPIYDDDGSLQAPAAFDDEVDSFTVSEADVDLSGTLPDDLDLHGCSVLTLPIADGDASGGA